MAAWGGSSRLLLGLLMSPSPTNVRSAMLSSSSRARPTPPSPPPDQSDEGGPPRASAECPTTGEKAEEEGRKGACGWE